MLVHTLLESSSNARPDFLPLSPKKRNRDRECRRWRNVEQFSGKRRVARDFTRRVSTGDLESEKLSTRRFHRSSRRISRSRFKRDLCALSSRPSDPTSSFLTRDLTETHRIAAEPETRSKRVRSRRNTVETATMTYRACQDSERGVGGGGSVVVSAESGEN